MPHATAPHPDPVPFDAPLPHRKVIRGWLEPLNRRNTMRAVALLVMDWALFAALIVATVLLAPWWAKLLCAVAAGLVIGRLFIIGHDACHQSYTAHPGLNRILGRIAMAPSLTPYSLWQAGHNVVHHGYTNLKGVDMVWAPLTRQEYEAMPPWRRRIERIYRSGWGPCLYYLVEMWWLRMYFPRDRYMVAGRPEFLRDCLLVTAIALLWIGGLVAAALGTGQSVWALLLFGFVVPFLVWNTLIGFVVYVHHTHPAIRWHDDKAAWSAAAPFVSTTVHLTFRAGIGGFLHNIMEHTAHHVDMSVPLYRLQDAQQLLEETLPGRVVVQRFSWRWYFDTARRCKLYDFANRCWTDFDGRPTSASHAPAAAAA
jgi:acyl-lipid omega-6 desaturase (Delta-12 desaturase)